MMYACKLTVNTEPQMISDDKEFNLGYDSTLTISELREYGVTDKGSFQIVDEENTQKFILHVYNKRLETEEEVSIRVAKAIAYNKACDEHHAKYPKK